MVLVEDHFTFRPVFGTPGPRATPQRATQVVPVAVLPGSDPSRGGARVAGSAGASVRIWGGLKGWDKTRRRAVFQPCILRRRGAALLMMRGLKGRGVDHGVVGFAPAILPCLPAGLFGTQLGQKCE